MEEWRYSQAVGIQNNIDIHKKSTIVITIITMHSNKINTEASNKKSILLLNIDSVPP